MSNKEKQLNSFELIAVHYKKELKAIFSDSGAVLILIGALLIYPIMYSLGYFNEVLTDIPVAVVDRDQTPTSRRYAEMLDASREVHVAFKPMSMKEAERLFFENKVTGVLYIPEGFQENIYSGRQGQVAVYADGSYLLKYKTFYTAASTVNAYFGAGIAIKRYLVEGKSLVQAKIAAAPLDVQTHLLYLPAGSYGSFVMPGMILIIIQQTLLIGIGIIGGTFSESKASPFVLPAGKRVREIVPLILGRAGAYLTVSAFNICLAVFIIHDWFHYPDKAQVVDILMLLFPFLLAVIFLGIGVSTLFKHRESAIVFMMFLSPIALFLTGISWPVSAIPEWLVYGSKILPGTIVVPAYLRLRTMGVGLPEVSYELFWLYGQAIVYCCLTVAYFYYRICRMNKKTC